MKVQRFVVGVVIRQFPMVGLRLTSRAYLHGANPGCITLDHAATSALVVAEPPGRSSVAGALLVVTSNSASWETGAKCSVFTRRQQTTELIPNALFKLPQFGSFIQKEMSFGLGQGIDYELLRALAAASGTTTYSQDSETRFECFRNAIKTARAAGYAPNLAILHPNDAADLDLERDGVDRYYGAGPIGSAGFPNLWGLKVAESISATEGSPILVDTASFGTLYFGSVEWAVNPYEEFRSNQSRGRLEVPMAVVVEQAAGIVEITLSA